MRWRVNLHGKPVGVDQPANIASVDTRACASSLCATSRREIAGRRSVAVQCTSGRRLGNIPKRMAVREDLSEIQLGHAASAWRRLFSTVREFVSSCATTALIL